MKNVMDVGTANTTFLAVKDNRYDLLVKCIESIEDYAIFILDTEGIIQTWNHGARKIKGYFADEVIGKHFSMFYTDEESSRLHPQRALIIASEKGRFEEEGWRVRKNGEKFYVNVVLTALKNEDGDVIAFSKVTRDLSDKQRISELEESIRMRDEFITVASHELRTPVTKILLNLQFVKRTTDAMSEKLLKALDVCETSTKELISIMDNLVDVSRLRLGQLEIRRTKTNITTIVLNVLTKFKDQIRLSGNHVSFVHDGDIIGYWDQTRLDQLFTNLLSNGIKYAEGKPIKLELKCDGTSVLFSIQDEGPGIPYNKQPTIFERFERAADTRKISGLGLGLYVSRQIVEAHKGQISLESQPGKGARFTVVIPVKQEKR